MNNYVRYRNWWMAHRGPVDLDEQAFKDHINSMTLFELMETLEGFGEEDNDEYAPGSQPEKLMEEWGLPDFPPPYIKYPTQKNPMPQCPKCGLGLSGVMGYVCSDQYCPTFMKVTC